MKCSERRTYVSNTRAKACTISCEIMTQRKYQQWQGKKGRENISTRVIKKNCDCSWKRNSWCSVAQLARPDPNRKINTPPLSDSSMADQCLTRTGHYHAHMPFHFVSAQGSPPAILSGGGGVLYVSWGTSPVGEERQKQGPFNSKVSLQR